MVGDDSWGSVVHGMDSWGSCVSVSDGWSSCVSGESAVSEVSVLDDGSGTGDLDNVLAPDWDGDGHMVWLLHVDGGGHLDQLLNMDGNVVWDGVRLLHMNWLIDDVGLPLDLDNSWVDLLGSLKGSWHSDADVWNGGLQDLGVVSGNVGLLSVVDLLGDLLWSLSDGHNGLALDSGGGVWSWHADGWCWGSDSQGWGSNGVGWGSDGVVAVGEAMSVAQWSSGEEASSWSHDVGWGGAGSSNHCRKDCSHWVHDEYKEWFYPKDK